MAYDRNKIFEQAKEVIVKHKLFFIEDIVAFLPIAKTTFYEYFPPDANETNELKGLLETNRIELKVSMRSKWYKSNAPALQMALMKLICSDDERKKLSMTYTENENVNSTSFNILNIDPLSDADNDSTSENIST
jgi:hypothetical protein